MAVLRVLAALAVAVALASAHSADEWRQRVIYQVRSYCGCGSVALWLCGSVALWLWFCVSLVVALWLWLWFCVSLVVALRL